MLIARIISLCFAFLIKIVLQRLAFVKEEKKKERNIIRIQFQSQNYNKPPQRLLQEPRKERINETRKKNFWANWKLKKEVRTENHTLEKNNKNFG